MEPNVHVDNGSVHVCAICNESISKLDSVTLKDKGVAGVKLASKKRGHPINIRTGDSVHKKCRQDFIKEQNIKKARLDGTAENTKALRSDSSQFDFRTKCMFCGQTTNSCERPKKGTDVYPVRTKDFQTSIERICKERCDEWAEQVTARIAYVHDLIAADAVYHQTCSVNFRTGKETPVEHRYQDLEKRRRSAGRPQKYDRSIAFLKVVEYLDANDDEQLTVQDLIEKMIQYMPISEEPYSRVYMKAKLTEHYGDKIVISRSENRHNVITFHTNMQSILKKFHVNSNENAYQQKMKILTAASEIIKSEIRAVSVDKDNYPTSPSSSADALEFVPDSLRQLLSGLVGNDLVIASIGQAIMQAARPRSLIAPLQIGLGVQLHHQFASKFLINSLHAHGFCSSYHEIKQFERSAAVSQGTTLPVNTDEPAIQFIADNVDHNVRTLDGNGTFHGMGMVASVTPSIPHTMSVPKVSVSNEVIAQTGRVKIYYYKSGNQETNLTFKQLPDKTATDDLSSFDNLWKVSVSLTPKRPSWAGFMQTAVQSNHPGKSSVVFLPMLDMTPSDPACVLTTLHYICDLAQKYNQQPVVTFDQPLWWKARMIVEEAPQNSVLKSVVPVLGGFHMQMSFLGCIGYLMAESGLNEVFETIYAANTIPHIFSGKAYARAIRGHMLVDSVLFHLLMEKTFTFSSASDDTHVVQLDEMNNPELEQVKDLAERLQSNDAIQNLNTHEPLRKVIEEINKTKQGLTNSKTATLWIQYMEMVDILRKCIKADRTGNWNLHLQAVTDMLPYFAASGHNLYAKSAYLYLQDMHDLEETHPEVYEKFSGGLHVVRRSDRYWAGLPTDLIIEQCLMRSIKTSGGLTRGRGMTEIQRTVWLLSMPICAHVNERMQETTRVRYESSEQHKESSESRIQRDQKDLRQVLQYMTCRSPFSVTDDLQSISTGAVATENINIDKAVMIGQNIVQRMVGQKVSTYSFKRKDQCVTFATDKGVLISNEKHQVNPAVLFQRLIAVEDKFDNKEELFKHELCSYPASLFSNSVLPREANKPELAKALWEKVSAADHTIPNEHTQYVVDGGCLLHRIIWKRGQTYGEIVSTYICYVKSHYGTALIVFDGYESGPSTKDVTHLRRSTNKKSGKVIVEPGNIFCSKREDFLSNTENKQLFIKLLGESLSANGCTVFYDESDADRMIAEKAIESAVTKDTVVAGDDTDLIVLLLHYTDLESDYQVYFKPQAKHQKTPQKTWNITRSKQMLGHDLCKCLPVLHAMLGCDTTSRIHGLGKGMAIKKFENIRFRESSAVFLDKESSQETIINAGVSLLLHLFNAQSCPDLDKLRYEKFLRKVATSTGQIEAQSLPPTMAAAKFHCMRVFFQVQDWLGNAGNLDPKDWGWKIDMGMLYPIQTDIAAAPEQLLNMINCKCKSGCSSSRCTCRKHGLQCTAMCIECKGQSCTNCAHPDFEDDVDNE